MAKIRDFFEKENSSFAMFFGICSISRIGMVTLAIYLTIADIFPRATGQTFIVSRSLYRVLFQVQNYGMEGVG